MRLIDADKLMLYLNNYALQESPSNAESAEDRKISRVVYSAIQNCMKAVEEQPTAFDVAKEEVNEKAQELSSQAFFFVYIKLQSDLSRSFLRTLRLRPKLRFWISGKP